MFKKKEIIEEKTFQISDYPILSEQINHLMMKTKQHGSFVVDSFGKSGNPHHKQLQFTDLVHSSKPLQGLIKSLAKIEKLDKRIAKLEKKRK